MAFAASYEHPCSLRYPRGSFIQTDLAESIPFELAKSQLLRSTNSDILFIGYGNGVGLSYETSKFLDEEVSILDLRFVKPLDEVMLKELAQKHKKWFVFSDNLKIGGVGSAILEFLSSQKILDVELTSFEYDDKFITHGNTKLVKESMGLLPEQLAKKIKSYISN